MKNLKKYQTLIIVIIVLLIIGSAAFFLRQPKMILFYSETCPHCKIVEDYIAANHIKDRYQFRELEVSQDQANAALLAKKASQCGLDPNQGLGVPFFFDGEKCLMGDQEIIDYFKK